MPSDIHSTERQPLIGRHASLAEALHAFAVDVMSIKSREDLYWYVAQNVVGRLGFADCVIYEADEDETELCQVAVLGEKNPYDRVIINSLRIPFGKGITGQVARDREPRVVDDLLENANYIPDLEPARSEICVPMIADGRVLGVIDSEHPDVGAFGPDDLKILTTVASFTSQKLALLEEIERSSWRYDDLVKSHAQLASEIASRKAVEAELFQARKLESIARLTGAFAHSFNNHLTAINGYLELAGMTAGEEAAPDLMAAREVAMKGGELIHNMLGYARRLQLKPEITDLNVLVQAACAEGDHKILDGIDLRLAHDAWPVEIDPSAIRIVLENLFANARDAMPEGGAVRVSTSNVHQLLSDGRRQKLGLSPGRYVRLDITDEGHGIPESALPQIFDPFFTTKPVGQGVGLGLSMVQGVMKQLGGAVDALPVLPKGTTFQLYIPAST